MRTFGKFTLSLGACLFTALASMAQTSGTVAPRLLSESPVLPAFPSQQVRPGRDRFNNDPALTTEALLEALKTNRTFRTNLSRHFGIPEERTIEFVQDALVPQVLDRDTRVMNYGVTKAGKIYGKQTTLRKGTRIWGTRDGKPILKWDCSNPLLPKAPILRSRPTPAQVSRTLTNGILPVPASLREPSVLDAPLGITLATDLPIEPIFRPVIPTPPITVVEEPSLLNPPTRLPGFARAGLPLIPLAGVIGLVVRTTPTPRGSVPEPGTLALLSLGAIGLLAHRRRR